MKMIFRQKIYFAAILSLFFLAACNSAKQVNFISPVDTKTKPIALQKKQTYFIKDIGVYASNEFDGARLNDFTKENDSTVLVTIIPENEPINNSGYYAFKTWSNSTKPFYFKF